MSLSSRLTTASIASALLLCGLGCPGDRSLNALSPQFIVEPEEVRFGEVATGTFAEETVVITNVGSATGSIFDMYLELADGQLELEWNDTDPENAEVGFELAPDEAMAAIVRYRPLVEGELVDTLMIDNEVAPIPVPINGLGNFEPIPDICSDPMSFDAGIVDYGDSVTQEFSIGNCGFGPLDIGQAVITGAGASHFSLSDDFVSNQSYPVDSSPGLLTVTFEPTADGVFEAQLELPTIAPNDDPDENPLIIPLSGRGQGAPLPKGPIAICGADASAGPLETVYLDGSASWDPNGHTPLTYEWSLTPPAGSAATLSSPNAVNPSFSTDLVGAYTAELWVTNSLGLRSAESCTTTITVAAAEDFRIELYWTYPEDVDLHLSRAGLGGLGTDNDCYYGNCTFGGLSWGGGGADPRLDIDDTSGTGPENINIDVPASGAYTVVVHDHPFTTYEGSQPITVNIYLAGGLADTFTFSLSGESECYDVATIDWPSMIVTPGTGAIGACSVGF